MTWVYANGDMCAYMFMPVNVIAAVVWQGPMEEQFLYWMVFILCEFKIKRS